MHVFFCADLHLEISLQIFDRVEVGAFAWPLQNIDRVVLKPFLDFLGQKDETLQTQICCLRLTKEGKLSNQRTWCQLSSTEEELQLLAVIVLLKDPMWARTMFRSRLLDVLLEDLDVLYLLHDAVHLNKIPGPTC